MDEYAMKFTRFSRFASYMVVKDGNRARRFEQDLNGEIKRYLTSHHLDTCPRCCKVSRKGNTQHKATADRSIKATYDTGSWT